MSSFLKNLKRCVQHVKRILVFVMKFLAGFLFLTLLQVTICFLGKNQWILTGKGFQAQRQYSSPKLSDKISTSTLAMGLFEFFKPKRTASASHILVKGENGPQFLSELKGKISASSNVPKAFADAARQYSTCPSSKNGGALGTFKQGMMVPAFDKVVFSEAIGVVHGPVKTPFGAHLILIDNRSDESSS